MSIRTYIIDEGDKKFSMMTGDVNDPGFKLQLKGKKYFEQPINKPVHEDDPHGHFFGAYELIDGKISINIEKAKEGYLSWLKELREVKLEELDRDQVRALGSLDFDKIKEIEQVKESLRDLPNLIDWQSAETIYDIMHIFPPILQ